MFVSIRTVYDLKSSNVRNYYVCYPVKGMVKQRIKHIYEDWSAQKINPLGYWGILLRHTLTWQKIKEVQNLHRPAGG
jgi:uncharacterized CHY-type Zn-finger protein